MTTAHKLRTLLAILECAPAARAMTVFESAARGGNLSLFWKQYRSTIRKSKHTTEPESKGEITLAMLEPAMKAVYDLPTTDGARAAAVPFGHDATAPDDHPSKRNR